MLTRPIVCERVRSQISLRLDGELSELESRMLDAHLGRCADCAAYDADARAFTTELRAAPLEPLARPIVLGRPGRRVSVARMQVGVAAAVAVAVLGVWTQVTGTAAEPAYSSPTKYATYEQLSREVQQIIRNGRTFQRSRGSTLPI